LAFNSPEFWFALVQIIWVNILLSGDNAVVIAMACRSLPEKQRRVGMVLGAGIAILMLIVFTAIVATLLSIAWLKVVGSVALVWIAVNLVLPEGEDGHKVSSSENLWRAIATIAVADVVMSLDNVIAVAAVAKGSWVLLIAGLTISTPIIIGGSALIMALIDRFPIIVWGGAALLGWVAGEMLTSDAALVSRFGQSALENNEIWIAATGAAVVLAIGWIMTRMKREQEIEHSGH
jgi:YjbE family integral membrane protein